MLKIQTDFRPESVVMPRSDLKTWHKPFENGTLTGYIADFKTEITSTFTEDGEKVIQSGIRVFVNLDNKKKGGYSFFAPNDPYFYFIPKKGRDKEVLAFLKKNRRLNGTNGIKDVKIYRRHIFNYKNDMFFAPRKVYRVILYTPNDVPKYSKLLLQHPAVYDCREYKIPFTIRCSIDLQLFAFKYYKFIIRNGVLVSYEPLDIEKFPDLRVMTFDIEVRKKPIRKPMPDDPINVIGVKIGDIGFLLNNVGLTHFPIPDFWIGVDEKNIIRKFTEEEAKKGGWKYKPVFFKAINTKNEKELLKAFYNIINTEKPQAINGFASDFFDFPHIQTRAKQYGLDFTKLFDQDHFEGNGKKGSPTFFGDFKRWGVQMFDTMDWVNRDSYISKGLRGLKSISKILLGIEAIEIDHEEQVRIWNEMETHWINPDHPENKDPKKFEENKKRAFKETFNHAIYCASDVFVTDIFAINSSLGLNMAVASRVPMNLFDVARKTKGPMIESDLLNRMHGKMVAPPKKVKKNRDYINPAEMAIKEKRQIFKEVKKRIEGTDYKFWAKCLTYKQMQEHCKGCEDRNCKEAWRTIWRLPPEKQSPILCKKETDETDPESQSYYYPLPNAEFAVINEKYEGAWVNCFEKGVFKDNADLEFVIDPQNFKKFEQYLHEALDRLIEKTESNPKKVKGYDEKVHVKVLDKEKMHKQISEQFGKIMKNLDEKDGKLIWKGNPTIIHVDVASMYPNTIITYNLQPFNVVDPQFCKKCPYRPQNGERECWLDMKWNAVYVVAKLSASELEAAKREIQKLIEDGKDLDEKEIANIYKKHSNRATKYNTFKIPMTARFCQKSFKFFTDTVKSFRDERYKYKYLMVDRDEEIKKIKSAYKENEYYKMLKEIDPARIQSEEYIAEIEKKLQSVLNDYGIPEGIKDAIDEILFSIQSDRTIPKYIFKMIQSLGSKYGDRPMPSEEKKRVDELSILKTTARNLQLGLKVMLNSIHPDDMVIVQFPNGEISVTRIGKLWNVMKEMTDKIDRSKDREGIRVDGFKVWNGSEFVPVKGIIRHKYVGKLNKIKTLNGRTIRVTDGHSLIILDKNIQWKGVSGEIFKPRDYVIYSNNPMEIEQWKSIRIPIGNPTNDGEDTNDQYVYFNLDDYVGVFFGIFFSELGPTGRNFIKTFEDWSNRIEYIIARISRQYGRNAKQFCNAMMSPTGFEFIKESTSDFTELPKFIYRCKRSVKLAFLSNYEDREGEIPSERVTFFANSKEIAMGLGIILRQVGYEKIIYYDGADYISVTALSEYRGERIPIDVMLIAGLTTNSLRDAVKEDEMPKELLDKINAGYRFDTIASCKKMHFNGYVYDLSVDSPVEMYMAGFGGILSHNSFYGYLKTVGSRFWSIEAAGATTLKGQEIINFAVNFCQNLACGINIELDTDGVWSALPSLIPLEIPYKFRVESDGNEMTDKFNLFNESLNYLVKESFTNHNNYVPVNEKGEYIPNIEYNIQWNKNRRWKQKDLCEIKYDYDGPYSTLFVYTKKRMVVFERDKKNPEIQKIETITGLEFLRKGELRLIQKSTEEIVHAYTKGDSLEEAYKHACDVANKYIDAIRNRTLDLDLIIESKDLSEDTAPKVIEAHHRYEEFLKANSIDPMSFPVIHEALVKNTKNNQHWKDEWFGKKDGKKTVSVGIWQKFSRSPHLFTAFRLMDMGISIETGDTVEFIISQYPKSEKKSKSVSERAIPAKLFDGDEEYIKKYLKRWFGMEFEKTDIRDLIDWQFYMDRYKGVIERYIIDPAKNQGIDVYKWLHLKDDKKKKRKSKDLFQFNPLIGLKN